MPATAVGLCDRNELDRDARSNAIVRSEACDRHRDHRAPLRTVIWRDIFRSSLYRLVRSPDKYRTVTFPADLQSRFCDLAKSQRPDVIRLKLIGAAANVRRLIGPLMMAVEAGTSLALM
jgi:hypothetical protein